MIVYQASKTSKKKRKKLKSEKEKARERGKRYDKVFRDGENKFNGL